MKIVIYYSFLGFIDLDVEKEPTKEELAELVKARRAEAYADAVSSLTVTAYNSDTNEVLCES